MADVTLNIRHNADQATSSVKSLSNAMGSFASNSKKATSAGTSAANGFKSIGKACLNAGRSATKGASGITKFVSSLKRIAFYRAIRSALRYVTDSFKQGLDAAYNWSKQQGGANARLAAAMDNLSAASGRMKLQLGAAFGGLITAIEPILIRIINLVTAAADAITRFFAVLNGGGYYKKAVGSLNDLGSAAGGAGKQVKGLLASWDELNVIGKESGGGGGGSNSTDYSGLYEWAEAESDWANLFASGDFFGIGAKIGDALGNISTKIKNWLKSDAVQNFGKNLAETLNGSVSNPENWENFGEAVGTFLGTIVTNIAEFLGGVEWDDVKEAIKAFWGGFKQALYDNTYLDENIQTMKDNFSLIMAWFDDLPAKAKNIGIKIANAVIREVENGINEVVNVYNGTWLADILGELDPVHFELIPEIPEEELNANWNKAAEEIRQRQKENPVNVTVNAEPGTQLDGTELFTSGTAYRPSGGTNGKKVGVGVVAVPSVKSGEQLNGTELFESGVANRPAGSTAGKKVGVGVAVVPSVGSTTEFNNSMNTNVIRYGSPWHAMVDPIVHQVNTFAQGMDKFVTRRSVPWSAMVDPLVHSVTTLNKGMGTHVERKNKPWQADVDPIVHSVTTLAKGMNTHVERKGNPWNAAVDPKLNNTKQYNDDMAKIVTNNRTVMINAILNKADLTKQFKDALNGIKININSTVDGVRKNIGKINTVAEYANGGFPVAGDLFLANEAGPEYVGSIGGKTAVSNTDQIVEGIRGGVAQANSEQNELLRQQNSILMQLLKKDLTITPSVALGQVVARSTALYGRA